LGKYCEGFNRAVTTAYVRRLKRLALGGAESPELYYGESLEQVSIT